jgi:hypothetical protein
MRRKQFKVILRHRETGEEIEKIIFAEDEEEARERATELARHRLVSMADHRHAQFDVVSCTSWATNGHPYLRSNPQRREIYELPNH